MMASEPLPPTPTLEQLRYVVKNFPIIDNHAHNILLPHQIETVPFESITSEATGRALRDTFKSLPHLRASRQLRELYQCSEDADWEEILEQRIEWLRTDPAQLYQKCFAGIHALLMDDGLAGPDKVYDYSWHDHCTQAPTKRILRIETVAEKIIEGLVQDASTTDLKHTSYFTDTWLQFTDDFEKVIQDAIADANVAGFKSVICYRTGLDIEPDYEHAAREVGKPFERWVERCIRRRKYRIERKALNDYLVLRALEILSEGLPQDALSKPIQFHTGLGDNDISLRESDPSYMQPLIESYPHVPFVLLHSAYPYTRQAAYLATTYSHVYLDIGEVFPMVSRDGQKTILRESLELTPGSKLLYSTDGHFFPETYWLANKQFREVWLDLMTEYVQKDDVTPHQAINITKDILFNNSNVLYNLRYTPDFKEFVEPPKPIAWHPKPNTPFSPSPQSTTKAPDQHPTLESEGTRYAPPMFPPPPKTPQIYDIQLFEEFMQHNPDIKFVYVQWLDYMATIRARILPIREFRRMIQEGERISISQGNTGTLQNDGITPVVNPVGQIYIEPDLRSLRRTHKKDPLPAATVLSFWRDDQGQPSKECPRSNLELLVQELDQHHDISLLCGFEIEVTFLNRNTTSTKASEPYTPLTVTHAWGTLTPDDWLQLPMLAEIADALEDIGIDIQQFHSESGPGQYEFILPPLPPLPAIDTLIQARQVIFQIAALHGLRATLHPKPFPGAATAAHAHISLNRGVEHAMPFFVGGVLRHLPAICAFSMPEAVSYERVVDGAWTGGTWVAWGTQNRETPLRRVDAGHWEVRCIDGMANMYFTLSAILAAGILGLKSAPVAMPTGTIVTTTPWYPERDVPVNPSRLSDEQRLAYGIREKMSASIEEAMVALDRDGELREMLAEGLVYDYLAMKRSELEMLGKMDERERRVWLIERY